MVTSISQERPSGYVNHGKIPGGFSGREKDFPKELNNIIASYLSPKPASPVSYELSDIGCFRLNCLPQLSLPEYLDMIPIIARDGTSTQLDVAITHLGSLPEEEKKRGLACFMSNISFFTGKERFEALLKKFKDDISPEMWSATVARGINLIREGNFTVVPTLNAVLKLGFHHPISNAILLELEELREKTPDITVKLPRFYRDYPFQYQYIDSWEEIGEYIKAKKNTQNRSSSRCVVL